jgi:hypothetical protein
VTDKLQVGDKISAPGIPAIDNTVVADVHTSSGELTQNSDALREKRIANLKPFQPGQSGNPGGKPKKKPQTEIYEELLQDPVFKAAYKEAIKARLLSGRMVGHLEGRELADRLEGKVTQKIDADLHIGISARVRKALELIGE